MATKATEQTVPVFIPLDPTAEDEENQRLFVGVNGRTFNIARGETVDVPVEVAEVLKYSDNARKESATYKRKVKNQSADKE